MHCTLPLIIAVKANPATDSIPWKVSRSADNWPKTPQFFSARCAQSQRNVNRRCSIHSFTLLSKHLGTFTTAAERIPSLEAAGIRMRGTFSAAVARSTRARPVCRRRSLCLRASSSPDPDVGPAAMTLEQAEQTLSVKRGADFETVLRAKNKQLAKAGCSDEKKFEVCVCRDQFTAVRRTA